MLRITADIFSGQPNPVWQVGDETEVRSTLRELTADRTLLTDDEPAESGLGFRGLRIEVLSDEIATDFELGTSMYLAVGQHARGPRAAEFGERLIGLIERGEISTEATEGPLALDAPLQEFLTTQLELTTQVESQSRTSVADDITPSEEEITPTATCTIELAAFNPGFWNNDPNVRSRNNCYNYASNWRTDTFAQPGRGCGHMYTAINCNEVARGAICDGMHRRFDCFPDREKPRYLVALVVAPGPGFVDYHWYRKHKEGFWGHKPGGTAARNVDNKGRKITNPETADRGPYTIFCGYFYGCNSQRRRIR